MRSQWHTLAYDPVRHCVWIVDQDGDLSVTNDAEAVVAEINHRHPACRIIYRDTMGNWDELRHRNGTFVGFAPVRDVLPP